MQSHIKRIRDTYSNDVEAKDLLKKQIVVAFYLIDRFAFRAGYDKNNDEVETVGCCKLEVRDVQCLPSNKVKVLDYVCLYGY